MRNALFAVGLILAALITGVAWTMQQTSSSTRATLTGRVVSVEESGHTVTIEAVDGESAVDAIAVGEPVEVSLGADDSSAGEFATSRGDVAHQEALPSEWSRRLMGMWLLSLFAAFVTIRARRPRLI